MGKIAELKAKGLGDKEATTKEGPISHPSGT